MSSLILTPCSVLRRVYRHSAPRSFPRSVLPGDLAGDEALRDVACFQIEMAIDRADLTGDVEARDRLFHRVEHALLDVVLGTALGVIDDRPGFHDVERPVLDRHHGFRRAFVVVILAFRAQLVPALDGCAQNFRIDVDLRGDVFE